MDTGNSITIRDHVPNDLVLGTSVLEIVVQVFRGYMIIGFLDPSGSGSSMFLLRDRCWAGPDPPSNLKQNPERP